MLLIRALVQEEAKKKFWILDPLYIALGTLLAWFYGVIPSYGVAIMLLTGAVCVLRMPLVAKQVKSQREMQRIQPELKRIQAKYKTEPQKRNEEMMKLYKEHGVNPFAGCLPVLLQMPLFIVLYRLIMNLSSQPPKHIPTDSRLYADLVEAGGKLQSFGMDLAESASKVNGFANLLPYLVLIGLVVATGLFQQRQMTARTPAAAMNTQMQLIGKVIPVVLGFISFNVPAGVVLYFLVSNLFQIGQQAVLFRRKDEPPAAEGKKKAIDTTVAGDDETLAVPSGGLSGFLNKLMKAPAAEPSANGDGETAKAAEDGAAKSTPVAKAQPPRAQPGAKKPAGGPAAPRPQSGAKKPAGGKASPPARSPNAPAKAKSSPKAVPPAPAAGGFFGRLFGGGGAAKSAEPARAKGAPARPAKGTSNGKAGSAGTSRSSGRAQPKGQPSAKSKSRNSRKGR